MAHDDLIAAQSAPSPSPASRKTLCWLRHDLRLADNPALHEAAKAGALHLVFIDETNPSLRPRGAASRWWLHHSLTVLTQEIAARGGTLSLLKGDSAQLIPTLARNLGCDLITWNRRYGEAERAVDGAIKTALKTAGHRVESFNSHLLREPFEVKSQAGGPMRVFTPFWKAARALGEPAQPLPAPTRLPPAPAPIAEAVTLDSLALLPTMPDWAGGMRKTWQPGEAGALKRLDAFINGPLDGYAANRDRPDIPSTSMLSPHIAFGELSPRQIWHQVRGRLEAGTLLASEKDCDKFLAEVGWREFAYHLLFHYPTLPNENYQAKFNAFPWREDAAALRAWQRGRTGYPLVDAGMRELWQTGFMHNRVRMICASFLIKHLLIDWREGEKWFWDTLCDADPANNAASWQWVAGSGADAAPYFRIFNPIGQGEKFDANGDYIRHYVPELARLRSEYIHKPWDAPPAVLAAAGVKLGETYPKPIVAHDMARARALAAFQTLNADHAAAQGAA